MTKEEVLEFMQDIKSVDGKFTLSDEQYLSNFDKTLRKQEIENGGGNTNGNLDFIEVWLSQENIIRLDVSDISNTHFYKIQFEYDETTPLDLDKGYNKPDKTLTLYWEENNDSQFVRVKATKKQTASFIKEFLTILFDWTYDSALKTKKYNPLWISQKKEEALEVINKWEK